MTINKAIIQSKNKGLFNSILNEINKRIYTLDVTAYYKLDSESEGLRFKAIVRNKNYKEVYNLE